jgi:hypothetical protein
MDKTTEIVQTINCKTGKRYGIEVKPVLSIKLNRIFIRTPSESLLPLRGTRHNFLSYHNNRCQSAGATHRRQLRETCHQA